MTAPTILFAINGQLQPVEGQTVNLIGDRGLAYGHGLFETLLLNQSTLPLLDRHLARLNSDSQLLGIFVEPEVIGHYLNLFLDALALQSITCGVIKIMITAGSGGRGYKSPANILPTVIFSYHPMSEDILYQRKEGIDISLCRHLISNSSALAGIKHLNRLDQVMARNEWSHNKYQDGLMFNDKGDVIEATSANIFIKTSEGSWLTPDLSLSGVSGVMRGLLIDEIFPACDIDISIAKINRNILLASQQIILCNAVKGILRVNSVYSDNDQLLMALPSDQQSLMLNNKLINLYPQYQ